MSAAGHCPSETGISGLKPPTPASILFIRRARHDQNFMLEKNLYSFVLTVFGVRSLETGKVALYPRHRSHFAGPLGRQGEDQAAQGVCFVAAVGFAPTRAGIQETLDRAGVAAAVAVLRDRPRRPDEGRRAVVGPHLEAPRLEIPLQPAVVAEDGQGPLRSARILQGEGEGAAHAAGHLERHHLVVDDVLVVAEDADIQPEAGRSRLAAMPSTSASEWLPAGTINYPMVTADLFFEP